MIRINLRRIISHGMLVLLLVLQGSQQPVLAAGDSVENISVKVSSPNHAPPVRVVKRIENSVSTVGEHVFLGKKIEDVAANRASYEQIVQDVFDRVLVGYSVQKVEIAPGVSTRILVTVVPWGDVVQDITLQVDLSSVSPEVHELIKRDMGNIEQSISSVLVGLPTDAVDWAGGVSRTVVRELINANLPEFRADLEVLAGQHAQVKLSLLPMGPTIQDVNVVLRSNTIPNILLWEVRPQVEVTAKIMRGLPVGFVNRHQEYFRERLTQKVADHPATQRYGLSARTDLAAGEETTVSILAETSKYKITLEGYLDMDKDEDNLAVKLHAGKNISRYDEMFTEITLIPNSMTWKFEPGWGRTLGTKTEAGLRYNLSDSHVIVWMHQKIDSKWTLRLERTPDLQLNEVGIRYRLHEFMSVEYNFDNHDKWLRLVGNL